MQCHIQIHKPDQRKNCHFGHQQTFFLGICFSPVLYSVEIDGTIVGNHSIIVCLEYKNHMGEILQNILCTEYKNMQTVKMELMQKRMLVEAYKVNTCVQVPSPTHTFTTHTCHSLQQRTCLFGTYKSGK